MMYANNNILLSKGNTVAHVHEAAYGEPSLSTQSADKKDFLDCSIK